ncbi:MAG: hypothetical protein KGN01_06275 [Patescibacteria group bacterium]|nr:hypothetical protein [Patescibacteria group bacterium]
MPKGVHSSPRGLSTASIETRRRVTSLGGYVTALRYGELFCRARSEKGGLSTLERYGPEHYRKINLLSIESHRKQKLLTQGTLGQIASKRKEV